MTSELRRNPVVHSVHTPYCPYYKFLSYQIEKKDGVWTDDAESSGSPRRDGPAETGTDRPGLDHNPTE